MKSLTRRERGRKKRVNMTSECERDFAHLKHTQMRDLCLTGQMFRLGLSVSEPKPVVSQPLRSDKDMKSSYENHVADKMSTIVLTHCVSLPPSLCFHHSFIPTLSLQLC